MSAPLPPFPTVPQRQAAEAQTVDEFCDALVDGPPLCRMLGHMTAHLAEMESQIYYELKKQMADAEDPLTLLSELRVSLSAMLQMQRQAVRNQELAAKLDGEVRSA
jgi:hypothetical protein